MRTLIKRTIASTMAALLLALTVVESLPAEPARPSAVSQPVTSSAIQAAVTTSTTIGTGAISPAAADFVATGWLERLACAGCVGVLLAATGTGSIAALLMVIGANPEAATGCAYGCIVAFS